MSPETQPAYGSSPPVLLDVSRLVYRLDEKRGVYVLQEEVLQEEVLEEKAGVIEDTEKRYAFTIIQKIKTFSHGPPDVTVEIAIQSLPFIRAAKQVMKAQEGIDWTRMPVKFPRDELLAFVPSFAQFVSELRETQDKTEAQAEEQTHVAFFLDFIAKEYSQTFATISDLRKAEQMSFNLIWSLLVPGSILYTRCETTGKPWAVRLTSISLTEGYGALHWALGCEYVNFERSEPGLSDRTLSIPYFTGVKRITDLAAYPLDLVPNHEKLIQELKERGRKRWSLRDWCHKWYDGIAYYSKKFSVQSRIILDMETAGHYGDIRIPSLNRDLDGALFSSESRTEIRDDEYMLMSPKVYGWSLNDRQWFTFSVDSVYNIEWSSSMFDQLEMAAENKQILRALVKEHAGRGREANKNATTFDDFVHGKGMGLIFNLHGPPGVGKTLTAEAVSEVTQRPLYVTGSGDLGTNASGLERTLTRVFALAVRWAAVVLIDEADVYLEQRNLHEIERNAMVAVFLRKLEYYPGILFLTTNRVAVFDQAMKSRIDLSLFYNHLSPDVRSRLWLAFFAKTTMSVEEQASVADAHMDRLRALPLNGREIKNIVKIASVFAAHCDRALKIEDVMRVVQFSQLQGQIERESPVVE
ncbi:P-loop containing nucleoside triphosphate hydrolase protein [Dentipellis sp. KUC8613]|nr:P-loop containing nucleoside triphosphate hydrolase protein [Dentipellis sp. KUC8613]